MKVSPHPTTLPLGSTSRSAKAARTSATCSAVIWSALARRSGGTGCPRTRSRTISRQKMSWSPRSPSASCLASSSSSVSCMHLLLVSAALGGLLPDKEVLLLGNIDNYPYLRQKILLSRFKSLQSLQQLLDRFERSSTEEVVGPHPMAYTINDTGFT